MYKKILVATDGTNLSEKAVTHAMSLAIEHDAELFVLNIIPHFQQYFFDGSLMTAKEEEIERLQNNWIQKSTALLEEIKKRGEEKGIKITTLLKHSKMVSKGIIKATKENNIDLIVMASHGRKGLDRFLLGSETQQVLLHSVVPVLVLR